MQDLSIVLDWGMLGLVCNTALLSPNLLPPFMANLSLFFLPPFMANLSLFFRLCNPPPPSTLFPLASPPLFLSAQHTALTQDMSMALRVNRALLQCRV